MPEDSHDGEDADVVELYSPEDYERFMNEALRKGDLAKAAMYKGRRDHLQPIDADRLYLQTPNNLKSPVMLQVRWVLASTNPDRALMRDVLREDLGGQEPREEDVNEAYNEMALARVGGYIIDPPSESGAPSRVRVYTPDLDDEHKLHNDAPRSTFGYAEGLAVPRTLDGLKRAGYHQIVEEEQRPLAA